MAKTAPKTHLIPIKQLKLTPWAQPPIKLPALKYSPQKAPDYTTFKIAAERKTTSKGKGAKRVYTTKIGPGSEVWPEATSGEGKTCREITQTSKVKGPPRMRDCHIEFVLLGPKSAPKLGVKPGAYLRFCQRIGQPDAMLVAVKDQREAQRIAKAACACKAKGEDIGKCVENEPGAQATRTAAKLRKRIP